MYGGARGNKDPSTDRRDRSAVRCPLSYHTLRATPRGAVLQKNTKGENRMDFVLIDDVSSHQTILSDQLALLCAKLRLPCHITLATTDWREVVAYAEKARPDTVYFLDIELEGEVDGIALCRMIHEKQARRTSSTPRRIRNTPLSAAAPTPLISCSSRGPTSNCPTA